MFADSWGLWEGGLVCRHTTETCIGSKIHFPTHSQGQTLFGENLVEIWVLSGIKEVRFGPAEIDGSVRVRIKA